MKLATALILVAMAATLTWARDLRVGPQKGKGRGPPLKRVKFAEYKFPKLSDPDENGVIILDNVIFQDGEEVGRALGQCTVLDPSYSRAYCIETSTITKGVRLGDATNGGVVTLIPGETSILAFFGGTGGWWNFKGELEATIQGDGSIIVVEYEYKTGN